MIKNGFTLIEVIIAIGLAVVFIPAIMATFSFALRTSSQGESFTRAGALAQEGMDVIFALKDAGGGSWNWTTTPADGIYQPSMSGNIWSLGPTIATTPNITEAKFTRKIIITSVSRCTTGDHLPCATGINDPNTRKIDVSITWPDNGSIQTASLSAYVTKH